CSTSVSCGCVAADIPVHHNQPQTIEAAAILARSVADKPCPDHHSRAADDEEPAAGAGCYIVREDRVDHIDCIEETNVGSKAAAITVFPAPYGQALDED